MKPECYRCHWLDGATNAVVGARLRGHNKLGKIRWQTTAVITVADPGREFAFTTVHDRTGRDETGWRYRVEPAAGGVELTESFEFLCCPVGNRVTELLIPRSRQVNRGIRQTLHAIKATAEANIPSL